MTAELAAYEAALKRLYKNELPEVGHSPPVTWSLLKKTTGFVGEDKSLPLKFARSQPSHTFTTAQTRARASGYARFLLTRGRDYHVVQMDGEALEAARDEGAVRNYLQEETRSGMDRMAHRMNRNLFRNYGMAQARIQSGGGTTTITVTDANDLLGLDVGDFITSSTDDGTGGAGVAGTTAQIASINREAGTITKTGAAWKAGGGFADNSYLFLDGDYGLGFYGAAAWFPSTAPTSGDSFFGRDRSTDPERLAGQRYTAATSDGDLPGFLKRALTRYSVAGGTGNTLIINPILWNYLDQQLGNKVRYGQMLGQSSKGPLVGHAGFTSIKIVGQHRETEVLADRDCPLNDGYIFDLDHFWWEGLGEAPRYLGYDGKGGVSDNAAWLRISNEDAIEGRIGARGQFASNAPGRCARLSIPASASIY